MEEEELFSVEADNTKACLSLAKDLRSLVTKNEHKEYLQHFSAWLLSEFEGILQQASSSLPSVDQTIIWSRFHQLRCSTAFQQKWKSFFLAVSLMHVPIFIQTVSSRIFDYLLKEKFPLSQCTTDEHYTPHLTYEEENAVRYVGGYVVRTLKKQVSRDEEVVVALNDLVESVDQEAEESEEWLGSIDRGGLIYITNSTFQCLCAIEYALRRHMCLKHAHEFNTKNKEKMAKSVENDEDVQFHWTMVSVEMDDDISDKLLHLIIDKWITIRGFSFAMSIMEMYKLQEKQGTQKLKRLRHKVPQN